MNSGLSPAKNFNVADEADLIFRDDPTVSNYSLASVDSGLLSAYAEIDRRKLRTYRLERIREQLRLNDYMGVLLADPLNIRYATDTNNLGLWVMHSPSRYVFVATEGPVILFDFTSSKHNSTHVETINEI
ncbi:MAG: aminopeptidase P family protein, partial [Cytophagaceae bacterium]